jgi:2-oxoglutarate dehydrogenase E1 component
MLRHPEALSPLEDLVRPSFLNVVTDSTVPDATRLIFCTGKIGHELKIMRRNLKNTDTAINFIDQLYPWPEEELRAAIAKFPRAEEIVWVQEEPANMGALSFVVPRLRKLAKNIPVRSVKRSAAASPATGSAKAHEMEQKTLLTLAFAG